MKDNFDKFEVTICDLKRIQNYLSVSQSLLPHNRDLAAKEFLADFDLVEVGAGRRVVTGG